MKFLLAIIFIGSYNLLYAQSVKPKAQEKLEKLMLEQKKKKEILEAKYNREKYLERMKKEKDND